MSDSLVSLLTALGDDELILGHRHSEWTGHAPHLEEDVAFSSIAQDEIGHATAYYELVAATTGGDADRIALGRVPGEYRHAVICERPNEDWAYTLVRHWLYDEADAVRLAALEASADERLAALVVKLRREERYHQLHADTWMKRLARGPVEARAKIMDSVTTAFEEALGLFEPFELEDDAVKSGWLPVPTDELRSRFVAQSVARLDELGLPTEMASRADQAAEFVASSSGDLIAAEGRPDADAGPIPSTALGGRRGKHSEEFDLLWEEMTTTYRSDPGASW